MAAIEFTQYIMPYGRPQPVSIDRPDEIAAKAKAITDEGYRFECEVLSTGEVSLTVCDDDGDLDIEVVPNGPSVPEAVDRLITRFLGREHYAQAAYAATERREREMKHARADYDVIQDTTAARGLAELVLEMGMATEKGQVARQLARQVLGLSDDRIHTPMAAIATNGTTRLIPAEEPVFLIRGQDAVGGDAVRAWAGLAEAAGSDPTILKVARDHAAKMDAWPKKKIADLPTA